MVYPVELESTVLLDAIYGVDSYIVSLEKEVKVQRSEITELRKTISDHDIKLAQESLDKVGRTISLILNHGKGEPPIDQDMGLDTALILKYLLPLVSRVRQNVDSSAEIYADVLELERYVQSAWDKALLITNDPQ